MLEQPLCDIHCGCDGNGDFETVFAGVAGAGNDAGNIMQIGFGDVHEAHGRDIGPQFAQHGFGMRTLQRDQRAVVEHGDFAGVGKPLFQMLEIRILAGGVDDEEQVVATVGDHQVVEDAAFDIGEDRITLPAFAKAEHIDRHQLFKRKRCVFDLAGLRPDNDLAHMGDIEETSGNAGVLVFLHHAIRVLHRHVVTGKGHHARAQGKVQRMQRRMLQMGILFQIRPPGLALPRRLTLPASIAVDSSPLCPFA
ncbi:hypothetical protein D9M68_363560 [compost metagenome]